MSEMLTKPVRIRELANGVTRAYMGLIERRKDAVRVPHGQQD